LYLKSGPEIFGALSKGLIDAGVLSAPMTLKARQSGFKELMNGAKEEIPMIHAAFGTTREFLAANRNRAKSFLQGYLEGIRLGKANRQEAREVIQKYTKTSSDDELKETYETFVDVWEMVPYVSTAAVKTLLEFATHPNAKTASPDQFIDNSIVAELEKTGFVKGLYR
jgi:NitT/TauT family transport system substrate-binding protein